MHSILNLLHDNGALSARQIADSLGKNEAEISEKIKELEDNHVILGYKAIIDWERAGSEYVIARIEVSVTPQHGQGFENIAEEICRFDEVESLYLMSGGYDFAVTVTGRTMKEVALFVAYKLSTIEGVRGTATHFVLKKYKEGGILYSNVKSQQETAFLV